MNKKRIALIVLVAGLAIYAGTLHMKLNSYHQFVEDEEFTPASIMLEEEFILYNLNPIIEESIEKEKLSRKNLSNLLYTFRNVRGHIISLADMAERLEGEEVNRNHLFEQLSEIIYTMERMKNENNGSVELNEEQINFLEDVMNLNDEMYSVFKEYESVSNEERKNFDRDYWIDYIKGIVRETRGIVVRKVFD
ncbi:hypothetical protein [Halobacillus litoralis]|uniref:Uncharacterized protein n=1 Tax=Halobacillus litoralis TaxID=45668 RepID=A0A410MFS0_9BACI|nr:hypothetical protein [Halobacillus litoralis]QAS53553.1 hypothetical protein HLI_15765 [Halobacillus litoralis]